MSGQEAEQYVDWLHDRIDNLRLPANLKIDLAVRSFHLTLEHQQSIVILANQKLFGSAFALIRPLVEAFIRGAWLWKCASDSEITNYGQDILKKNFSQLLAEVEKDETFKVGTLSKLHSEYWKAFNSYTHGGMFQLSRRRTETEIDINFDAEEISQCIWFAVFFGSLAAIMICDIANNHEAANSILQRFTELYSSKDSQHNQESTE